jgi:electron transfer flavoprotein beta subunit
MLSRTSCSLFRASAVNRMTVCVGVKRVVDYSVKVRVKDNAVALENVKMSVNPFDAIAIEQAVQMKEKKIATTVIAVTIGPKKSEEALRNAMALGCDKAIHVMTDDAALEPLAVAKIMAKLHEEVKPEMWILGKQAIDGDYGATPSILAGLLDVGCGTYASKVEVADGKATVTREIDAGLQVVTLALPCVIAADLRLNTPRYASLPNIMKARKKPIDVKPLAGLGLDTAARLATVTVVEPPVRKAGIKVKSVEELFDKLKNEAKVI